MSGSGMEDLLRVIEETFPLPARFRSRLPSCVAELSRLLTSARSGREGGYLNRPDLLSAYIRFFLPWNVFRLLNLFGALPDAGNGNPFGLTSAGAVTDLGSGPLTLPAALWIAFPALRNFELEIRCVDKSAAALDAGLRLFRALSGGAGGKTAWNIRIIHDPLSAPVRGGKARLVGAVNVFNETFRHENIRQSADRAAGLLCKLCADDGAILTVEPGVPQSGAFIAALRGSLINRGRLPAAPCTHGGACPMSGGTKWCHFAHDTKDAPETLRALSRAAGIPKERAVFSYLLTETGGGSPAASGSPAARRPAARVRVISDAFPIPETGRRPDAVWGRYGCGETGLILISGGRTEIESAASGTLLELLWSENGERDRKTGARIARIQGG